MSSVDCWVWKENWRAWKVKLLGADKERRLWEVAWWRWPRERVRLWRWRWRRPRENKTQQSMYYKVTSHAFGLANRYQMDGIEDWELGLGDTATKFPSLSNPWAFPFSIWIKKQEAILYIYLNQKEIKKKKQDDMSSCSFHALHVKNTEIGK